ncbi:hypothetical protein AAHA92_07337 [Salvia divinorum]|uniref:Uncharacterized protein n=1 Tax=Salvia divinorum TaxID=28513 RepID=A0ABD1I8L7_SALDI
MSELCSSNSKYQFSSLFISDFILLCSFILSHPLYFSYLIFFSPYLFKLLSFLSPLFITTSLIFLAFLSQSHFTSILLSLQSNKDHNPNEEPQNSDDLGIYEIVFGPPSVREETLSQFFQKDPILEPNPLPDPDKESPITTAGKIENSGEFLKVSKTPSMEEKRLENFLKILDNFERLASNVEEKKIKLKQNSLLINGSETAAAAICNSTNQSNSQRIIGGGGGGGDSFSSYGSMRREREWKRTLAGKLFEERHNNGGGGGEGMDSLWEAYEMESDKRRGRRREKEEEDDEIGGEVCCLQALKMSAGKMSLGVGRPKLAKISKAIKGIGWLHSLTKNSKKVHDNGDHRY